LIFWYTNVTILLLDCWKIINVLCIGKLKDDKKGYLWILNKLRLKILQW
jgi:hypothetical protein